jgi:TatD DNase family protein
MLVDTHCHLDDERFEADRSKIVSDFSGIIINCGTNLLTSTASIRLAKRYENLYPTVGIHPHYADSADEDIFSELERLTTENRIVAIGECGLDFYRNISDREKQKEVFKKLITMGKERGLPLIVHSRDAISETLKILKEMGAERVVLHSFSGERNDMKEAVNLGFYIGISGVVTFKGSKIKEIVKEIPQDKLLFETDAPYLAPSPFRGMRNKPQYVKFVAEVCASLLGISTEDAFNINYQNAKRLFGI